MPECKIASPSLFIITFNTRSITPTYPLRDGKVTRVVQYYRRCGDRCSGSWSGYRRGRLDGRLVLTRIPDSPLRLGGRRLERRVVEFLTKSLPSVHRLLRKANVLRVSNCNATRSSRGAGHINPWTVRPGQFPLGVLKWPLGKGLYIWVTSVHPSCGEHPPLCGRGVPFRFPIPTVPGS